MKIRSKALYTFLLESGVLNSQDKTLIAEAKHNYRKYYQRNWKRNRPKLKKEVRFLLTHREYFDLKIRATESGLLPTEYSKDAVLTSVANMPIIPKRKELESILQAIGIAASLCQRKDRFGNISGTEVETYLLKAENLLSDYLQSK
jgi:hypothetical protein